MTNLPPYLHIFNKSDGVDPEEHTAWYLFQEI